MLGLKQLLLSKVKTKKKSICIRAYHSTYHAPVYDSHKTFKDSALLKAFTMSFTIGLFGPGVGLGFDLDLDNFSDTLEHWGDPCSVNRNCWF